jgi:hypothetical protein
MTPMLGLLLAPLFWFWLIAWALGALLFAILGFGAFGLSKRFRSDGGVRDLEDDSRFHGKRPYSP